MEKLFSENELSKIKTGSFNIESLTRNGTELTTCSFYTDNTGNALSSYLIEYNVNGEKLKDIFISSEEKVNGSNISECANNMRQFLNNKYNIIIDPRGTGCGAIDVLNNDYLTDSGVLYRGISTGMLNNKFQKSIIPVYMVTINIHCAISKLREFIANGRFHVNEYLYEKVLNELSSVVYEVKNDGVIYIYCDKREYIDNILLICETDRLYK